jgi:hypothetical protein
VERDRIRAEIDLFGFLQQKNISEKNITRLESLCEFDDPEIRQLAKAVLDIARVAPRKRKRAGFLRHHHPHLYQQLVQLGVYEEWIEEDEPVYPTEDYEGPRYIHDDATEFDPDLYPIPDLCVSCVHHEGHDAAESVLCILTRADQQGDRVFLCFAYQPVSQDADREAILRQLCRRAGVAYPQDDSERNCEPDSIPF